jgi:hypothetical protein
VLRGHQRRRPAQQLAGRLAAGDGSRRHGGGPGPLVLGCDAGAGRSPSRRRVALARPVQSPFDRVARGSAGHRRKGERELGIYEFVRAAVSR